MTGRGWRKRALAAAFLVAVLAFAAVALAHQWGAVRDDLRRLSWPVLAAAYAAVLAGLLASAAAWRAVVGGLGTPAGPAAAFQVFFAGQLGKYLPGSVWSVMAQVRLGERHRLPKRDVGAAALVVMALNVTTGVVVGFALLAFGDASVLHHYLWLLAVVPAGVAALHPAVLNRVVVAGARLLRQPPPATPLTGRSVAAAVGWTAVMWCAYGVHALLLARALGAPAPSLPVTTTGAFALAWVAGFLVVAAPAGVGAREIVLVLALAPPLTAGAATSVALASRLLMTAGDVAWGLVAVAAVSRHRPALADPP